MVLKGFSGHVYGVLRRGGGGGGEGRGSVGIGSSCDQTGAIQVCQGSKYGQRAAWCALFYQIPLIWSIVVAEWPSPPVYARVPPCHAGLKFGKNAIT